jgi:hypothetical protein
MMCHEDELAIMGSAGERLISEFTPRGAAERMFFGLRTVVEAADR